MIGLIAFSFKILFASVLGASLNYIPGKEGDGSSILETSLICILSSSILALTKQFSNANEYVAMGFGVLSVAILIVSISKNLEFEDRIVWLFAAIIGMIIGAGYFLQASFLCVLIYIIMHNSENIFKYMNKHPDDLADRNIEKLSN